MRPSSGDEEEFVVRKISNDTLRKNAPGLAYIIDSEPSAYKLPASIGPGTTLETLKDAYRLEILPKSPSTGFFTRMFRFVFRSVINGAEFLLLNCLTFL